MVHQSLASLQKLINVFIYISWGVWELGRLASVCARHALPLTLYDPGGGGFKSPPLIFCPHAFNFGATILCVGDFSQKIV